MEGSDAELGGLTRGWLVGVGLRCFAWGDWEGGGEVSFEVDVVREEQGNESEMTGVKRMTLGVLDRRKLAYILTSLKLVVETLLLSCPPRRRLHWRRT